MNPVSIKIVLHLIHEWLEEEPEVQFEAFGADAELIAGKHRFLVEFEDSADANSVRRAIRTLRKGRNADHIAVVVVPYMGTVGKRICEEERISWIDLSGNTDIQTDDIRILISGKAKKTQTRQAISNIFAPKASRVARFFLQYPFYPVRQIEVCRHIDLSRSFVSRIIRRMVEEGFIRTLSDGSVICDEPQSLIDKWDERFDFGQHVVTRLRAEAEGTRALMDQAARLLEDEGMKHAFTGLAAAWASTGYPSATPVSIYVDRIPRTDVLSRWGLVTDEKQPNLWLIEPVDEGVFHGAARHGAYSCVHPVQVYLDVKAHQTHTDRVRDVLRDGLFDRSKQAPGF